MSSITSLIEKPYAPAFITAAPPIEPGMPTAFCMPAQPARAQRTTVRMRLAPPSARTRPSSPTSTRWAWRVLTTSSSSPSSATTRFDPPPSTRCGTSSSARSPSVRRSSSDERGRAMTAAGPPTPIEVCFDSGSRSR